MGEPEIIMVEACIPKPGDMIIVSYKGDLDSDVYNNFRYQLDALLKPMDVEFLIVAGASLIHLKKAEISDTIDKLIHNNRGA